MSRFTTTLARILEQRNLTKSDLARIIAVSPATVGDYLSEQIAVTAKNLPKILRGISEPADQVTLLLAHLEDQVPPDLQTAVTLEARAPASRPGLAEEGRDASWQSTVIALLGELPSRQRNDIVRLVVRLRDDTQLRDLLGRTLDYIGEEHARVDRRLQRQVRGHSKTDGRRSKKSGS